MSFSDKRQLLDFLLRRRGSRMLILQFIRAAIEEREPLELLAYLFDTLNRVAAQAFYERYAM